jgi:hypothetical protein
MMLQLIARIGFAWVRWQSRQGLRDPGEATESANKHEALQLGVRGETYAYWYLRRLGYVFIARNYMPSRAKGELDLIGYDGETLAIENAPGQPAVVRLHKAALSPQLSPAAH